MGWYGLLAKFPLSFLINGVGIAFCSKVAFLYSDVTGRFSLVLIQSEYNGMLTTVFWFNIGNLYEISSKGYSTFCLIDIQSARLTN